MYSHNKHLLNRQQLKLKTSIHITVSIYLFLMATDLFNFYLNSQAAIVACMVTRTGFPEISWTRISWENARKMKVHVFPSVHRVAEVRSKYPKFALYYIISLLFFCPDISCCCSPLKHFFPLADICISFLIFKTCSVSSRVEFRH